MINNSRIGRGSQTARGFGTKVGTRVGTAPVGVSRRDRIHEARVVSNGTNPNRKGTNPNKGGGSVTARGSLEGLGGGNSEQLSEEDDDEMYGDIDSTTHAVNSTIKVAVNRPKTQGSAIHRPKTQGAGNIS